MSLKVISNSFLLLFIALYYLKGLCRQNVNIENQQETCLQIGTYVGLTISFLIQITLTIISDVVTLRDKAFIPQVIKN